MMDQFNRICLNLFSTFLFFLTLWLPSEAISAEKTMEFTGIAKNHRGEEQYKEVHKNVYQDDRLVSRKSEFFDTKGKLIAEITTDFSKSLYLPDYRLINHQADEEEILRVNGEHVNIRYRSPGNKEFIEKTFPVQNPMVSGFGVGEYASKHIKAIANGESQDVNFLPVPRMASYPMSYKKTQVKGQSEDPNHVGVIFEINLGVFGAMLPSAEFVFDKNTGNILFFHGPTNITTKHGANPTVLITYTYK